MKNISKNAIIGYPAGIITGITYGLIRCSEFL